MTKSLQKLYIRSFFGPFFTQKSFSSPLKGFWPQVLKTRFHFCKHCTVHFGTRVPKSAFLEFLDPHFLNFRLKTICWNCKFLFSPANRVPGACSDQRVPSSALWNPPKSVYLFWLKVAERGWESGARPLSWKSGWKPLIRREFWHQRI